MISQEDLDRLAAQLFERAIWNPQFCAPCGYCRYGNHAHCKRWDTVLVPVITVPTLAYEPVGLASHIRTRQELHICGCDCEIAREIQGLKAVGAFYSARKLP